MYGSVEIRKPDRYSKREASGTQQRVKNHNDRRQIQPYTETGTCFVQYIVLAMAVFFKYLMMGC